MLASRPYNERIDTYMPEQSNVATTIRGGDNFEFRACNIITPQAILYTYSVLAFWSACVAKHYSKRRQKGYQNMSASEGIVLYLGYIADSSHICSPR